MACWSKLSSPPGLFSEDPQPQSVSLFQAKNTGAETRPGEVNSMISCQQIQSMRETLISVILVISHEIHLKLSPNKYNLERGSLGHKKKDS